jgi:hypothetical protein
MERIQQKQSSRTNLSRQVSLYPIEVEPRSDASIGAGVPEVVFAVIRRIRITTSGFSEGQTLPFSFAA